MIILTLLFLKHFICDFLYQPKWMWENKGTLFHYGGVMHSLFHAILTVNILVLLDPKFAWLAIVEFFIHYIIDYCKMNINKKFSWTATTHNEFWVLLGVDQLLHSLTYIAIFYIIT